MEMQSVATDCNAHTPLFIDTNENEINGLRWYFNHPVNCAWVFVFSGLILGISGVRHTGLLPLLILVSVTVFLNLILMIVKGISNFKIYLLCMAFACLAVSLRFYNDTKGFSGTEIRNIVDESRPRLLTIDGYVVDREIFDNG